MPPLKLKPFNTGYSKVIGEPNKKKIISGNKIINPRDVHNTGYL